MKKTAAEIFDMLVKEDKILEAKGRIEFHFGNVDIIVKQKDVVGNIMQEWLQGWLDKKNIEYGLNENSQMPPDFFLDRDNKKHDLLEVKAFNRKASPGFDIADFAMYQEEIVKKPYMINVDYMIFGYDMSDNGDVTIKDVWLKKVWEITRCMEKWALNLQVKKDVVHKIRPGVWYSKNKRLVKYPIFMGMEDFLSAVEETVYQNPKTHNDAAVWKKNFIRSYEAEYGEKIEIPRWSDIEGKYRAK